MERVRYLILEPVSAQKGTHRLQAAINPDEKLFEQNTYKTEKGLTFRTFILAKELGGAQYHTKKQKLDIRSPFIAFIPVILLDLSTSNLYSEEDLQKQFGFTAHANGRCPLTSAISDAIKITSTTASGLTITFSSFSAQIPAEDEINKIFSACKNLALGISSTSSDFFTRVAGEKNPGLPKFPCRKGSLSDVVAQLDIAKIHKFQCSHIEGAGIYLDSLIDDSRYYLYRSIPDANTIPKPPSFNCGCFVCGKTPTTKEHCSPSWFAKYYEAKPLIASIFCESCNSWFGKEFEQPAREALVEERSDYDPKIFAKWAIKTALTMSLASGIQIKPEWLKLLRMCSAPAGFKVYYDPTVVLKDKGYIYYVSDFSPEMIERGAFLFALSTKDFTLCVMNTSDNLIEVPLDQFFPEFIPLRSGRRVRLQEMYPSLHQQLLDSFLEHEEP